MRDIFEFNHIDQTLSKEKVKILKDFLLPQEALWL